MLATESDIKLSPTEVPPESGFGMVHLAAIDSCLLAQGSFDTAPAVGYNTVESRSRGLRGAALVRTPHPPGSFVAVLPPQAEGETRVKIFPRECPPACGRKVPASAEGGRRKEGEVPAGCESGSRRRPSLAAGAETSRREQIQGYSSCRFFSERRSDSRRSSSTSE
jgi:hypothetical protein